MRFLIDENVSPTVGDLLRAAGHDLTAAAVICPGATDARVVALAQTESRVVISDDKDFDELAFRDGVFPPGIVRLVLPAFTPAEKGARILAVLAGEGARIPGSIVVIEPARTRLRSLP